MHSKTNFSQNKTGKLLCDCFVTVRLHDGKYQEHEIREITLRGQSLGFGKVMSVLQFKMRDLPDSIAFMDCGHNAEYLKTMLYRFYKDAHNDCLFDVVVIHWTERVPTLQRDMFTQYWDNLVQQAPHINDLQLSFQS